MIGAPINRLLSRCHVEALVVVPRALAGELWIAVNCNDPGGRDLPESMRDLHARIAHEAGVERVRLRWRPDGNVDSAPEEYNAGAAVALRLGLHREHGDAYALEVVNGAGVYAIADPDWTENATAVWKMIGPGRLPAVAFVATAQVGTALSVATGGGALSDLVAWCRIPPYGEYPDHWAQRLALNYHRQANG